MHAFTAEDRALLLKLARTTVERVLQGESFAPPPEIPASLQQPCSGAFVTLCRQEYPKASGLRGCIGTFTHGRIIDLVLGMSRAVLDDPRFSDDPVTLQELPELHIELSILHPLRRLCDPLDFDLGVDGIEVTGNGRYLGRRGVYLPQVAIDHRMDKAVFLSSCCGHKAGMDPDAWRNMELCDVYAFRTERIAEA